jgi:hypothetical protein
MKWKIKAMFETTNGRVSQKKKPRLISRWIRHPKWGHDAMGVVERVIPP